MIVRRCSGGVVFYANKVLLVKNDRHEWTLPKGKVKEGQLAADSAVERVRVETGVYASPLVLAGDTMYEFFSRSRKQQVCNAIVWYVMEAESSEYIMREDFVDGGFYKIKDAIEMLSHSKEKALVDVSYKKFKEEKKSNAEVAK